MTTTEFLIIGQGISGTFVSWYLEKAGREFIVMDDNHPYAASRVAAGIINPVTGRRVVRSWMIETLLPFSLEAYRDIGILLNLELIAEKGLVHFFPTPQMLNAFTGRLNDDDEYLSYADDSSAFSNHFNYDFGYGMVKPCYMIDLTSLLKAWNEHLNSKERVLNEAFIEEEAMISADEVRYRDIIASKIIFCDGINSANSKWFSRLPFALNRGEALIIEADLPETHVYKKALTIAPLGNKLFWVGSSHEWDFTDPLPSENFLNGARRTLSNWLKQPFKIVSHLASVRPATVERRPFVGIHPHMKSVATLNGMGTKGCSLAPYFADQLVKRLTENTAILPEADVARFKGILKTN